MVTNLLSEKRKDLMTSMFLNQMSDAWQNSIKIDLWNVLTKVPPYIYLHGSVQFPRGSKIWVGGGARAPPSPPVATPLYSYVSLLVQLSEQ